MNITKEVWNILKSDIAIQKDIARGLINSRALARYILERHSIKASMDSIISAIRRFESEENLKEDKKLVALFKDAIIATKNNRACLTLPLEALELPIFNSIRNNIRVIIGINKVKAIGSSEIIKSLAGGIPQKYNASHETNLSELSITLVEQVIGTKGVLARMANEIALSNINIEEIVICPPEFLIYIKQENILKAYESILKLNHK